MPEEGVPANKACDLEHLVLAKPLEFTPGIRIDLELAKEKFMEDIRGDVHFYTAFVNPHGMVSDCFGPLTINYVGPPDDPEVYFAYSDTNQGTIFFDEENQKYWGNNSPVEFFVQLDFNQLKDVVHIYDGDDCMQASGEESFGDDPETTETLLSKTYNVGVAEITKSAKVINSLIEVDKESSCASAKFQVDRFPPRVSDKSYAPASGVDCGFADPDGTESGEPNTTFANIKGPFYDYQPPSTSFELTNCEKSVVTF